MIYTPPASSDTKTLKIVALGDSTTAGTPGFFSPSEKPPAGFGNIESQYAYWIERAHPDWQVLNRGVRGQRTDQIAKRFEREVVTQNPDVVVILAGINDLYQGYEAEYVKKNLETLYEKCLAKNYRLVVCTILPFNLSTQEVRLKIDEVNRWIQAYAVQRGVGFCDTFKFLENPSKPHHLISSPDDIHPDISGYRRMAEKIGLAIEDSF